MVVISSIITVCKNLGIGKCIDNVGAIPRDVSTKVYDFIDDWRLIHLATGIHTYL